MVVFLLIIRLVCAGKVSADIGVEIKPLESFFRRVAKSVGSRNVFTHIRQITPTASIAASVGRKLERASSLSASLESDEQGPGNPAASLIEDPKETVGRNPLPLLRTLLKNYDNKEVVTSGKAAETSSQVSLPSENVQDLLDQFHRHTKEQMANATEPSSSTDPLFGRHSRIFAQLAAFRFSAIVPFDILRNFAPTHRVILKTGNMALAQHDLMQISHIWSQSRSSLGTEQSLRDLSKAGMEKVCKLLAKGLHRYVYWSELTGASKEENEGAVDRVWWSDFADKLDAIGFPNSEGLYEQLMVVGSKYIDVGALQDAMDLARVAKYPEKALASREGKKEAIADEIELDILTKMEEGTTPEFTQDILEMEVERPSPLTVRRPSTTAIYLPVLQSEPCEEVSPSIRNCRLTRRAAASSGVSKGEIPSSSDLMKEVIAFVDAAIEDPDLLLDPLVEESEKEPSQLPFSPAAEVNQPALSKRKYPEAEVSHQERRDSPQDKASSVPITRENGWISAMNLQDSNPRDVVCPEVVYAGPSRTSNKARGKLPMRAGIVSEISQIPPPLSKTCAGSRVAAVRSSIPRSKAGNCKAEMVQVAPRSTVSVAVAGLASTRRTSADLAQSEFRIPTRVRSRKFHIPGMYPTESTESGAEE